VKFKPNRKEKTFSERKEEDSKKKKQKEILN